MENEYADLVHLIADNRDAMEYFKTLPDKVKSTLSQNGRQVKSMDSLKSFAQELIKRQR